MSQNFETGIIHSFINTESNNSNEKPPYFAVIVALARLRNGNGPLEIYFIETMNDRGDSIVALPGGKPEKGESIEDAARRELNEEIGVQVKQLIPVMFGLGPDRRKNSVFIMGFLSPEWSGNPYPKDMQETKKGSRFMTLDELREILPNQQERFMEACFILAEESFKRNLRRQINSPVAA